MIDDNDLERFLRPLLVEWNGLPPAELRALCSAPLRHDPGARVSYLGEESTSFGYRYVELEVTKASTFTLNLKLEGTAGDLSMAAYLPVVRLEGDERNFGEWLRAAAAG